MSQFLIDTKNNQYQHVSYLLGEAEIAQAEGDSTALRKEFADLLDKIALRLHSEGHPFDSHRQLLESFQVNSSEQQPRDAHSSKEARARDKSSDADQDSKRQEENVKEHSSSQARLSSISVPDRSEKDSTKLASEESLTQVMRRHESGDSNEQQKTAAHLEKMQALGSNSVLEDSLLDSMKKKASALLAGLGETENKGVFEDSEGGSLGENLMRAILLELEPHNRAGQSLETPLVKELLLSPLLLQKAAETDLLGAVNDKNGALVELRALQSGAFGAFDKNNIFSDRENQTLAAGKRRISQTAIIQMMQRVESALKEAARSKDGKTISLRLDPPNLGNLKVDVSIRDSVLHARLTAESSQVTYLLREKAHELQEMLRKLGLNVQTVSVSVKSEDEHAKDNNKSQRGNKEQEDFLSLLDGVPVEKDGDKLSSGASEKTLDHWIA